MEFGKGLVLNRIVCTAPALAVVMLGAAACQPPPPTREERLAKWGPTYTACLAKYAGADGATPAEQAGACKSQFERSEEVFQQLDTKLRIKPPANGGDGSMSLTATNDTGNSRLYREFTVRVIFYPDTVKFMGEAGARKTHEELWTVRADIAPGETKTFHKQPERPLKQDSEHYFHFSYAAKYVSLK